MTRRRKVWFGVAAVAAGAVGVGVVTQWRTAERVRLIAPVVQEAPAAGGLPVDVQEEMRTLRTRAAAGEIEALAELSKVYHANGFLVEAAALYGVLEKLAPEEPRWLHRHATIAAGFGESAPAIARWRRVEKLAPDYLPAQLRLGEALLKGDRRDEAREVFAGVRQRAPDNPHALLGLARLDVEARAWTEAREKLERVVTQTGYTLGYDLIVTVYEKLGQSDLAAAVRARAKASGAYLEPADPWMEALLDHSHDPYQLALAAGTAERRGDVERAVRWLERAVRLAPGDVAVHFQLAGVQQRRGDPRAARVGFERCTQLDPEFADGWAHLAALLDAGGDREAAERTVLAGLRHCPDSPGLHLMRARHLRRGGNSTAAVEAYRRAIDLRPNEADAFVEAATLLFQLERGDEAKAWLRQAVVVEPDHPTALQLLTLAAVGAGDEAGARQWLERVAAQPRVPPAQAQQLRAAFRQQFGREYR